MIVLYILLFIVCLSVLIMIHEAGHLIAAKAFNVYCFDYSIGFGPALLHKKRKNGETYFSIRAIPFGGFVSMYGEEMEGQALPDGVKEVAPERSLNRIKKWKRAIVLAAGVTMNALLALVLFFTANLLPQQQLLLRYFDVTPDSVSYNAGISSEKPLFFYEEDETYNPLIKALEKEYVIVLDINSFVTYNDSTSETVITALDYSKLTFKDRDFDKHVAFYTLDSDNKVKDNLMDNKLGNVDYITFTLIQYDKIDDTYIKDSGHVITLDNTSSGLESTGLTTQLYTQQYNFGEALGKTFIDFGDSATLIFRTLGGLFVGKGWSEIGGIISIYQISTNALTGYNLARFIYLWAVVSVNLAIMNLLPFPGLDGWQLVVVAFEAITKKEMPSKVKNIISFVGIVLLMALMVVVLLKDIIGLF